MTERQKQFWVRCPICEGFIYPVKIVIDDDNAERLKTDIKRFFICQSCHNDPTKLQRIAEYLGVPE